MFYFPPSYLPYTLVEQYSSDAAHIAYTPQYYHIQDSLALHNTYIHAYNSCKPYQYVHNSTVQKIPILPVCLLFPRTGMHCRMSITHQLGLQSARNMRHCNTMFSKLYGYVFSRFQLDFEVSVQLL